MTATSQADPFLLRLRARVRGATRAGLACLPDGRKVMLVEIDSAYRRGALTSADSETLAAAATAALRQRIPLVVAVASSGANLEEGLASLDGWGRAARSLADCSGVVPVVAIAYGMVLSGPALMLGMADVVVMTDQAVAYVSGPAAVAQLTGLRLDPATLGGQGVHQRTSGVASLVTHDVDEAFEVVADLLSYLPDHTDQEPPAQASADPPDRPNTELRQLLPAAPSGSYDVRKVIAEVADEGEYLELRGGWAPQLVTALCRLDGCPLGVVANQPQSMAGTLDIAASQKGAAFVSMCDSFNIPLLTLVDTPGFMPGKDLEWRGMIRHGAQLVYAYAEASVPRVSLILRKAFGGAYIVMDSKAMGSDLCLAWPSAQVAVMGAQGAVQILHRREDPATQALLAQRYEQDFLNPYVAAERGFVDAVIDPADTRRVVAAGLTMLRSKKEVLSARKHGNGPM